jgi:diacylglycerol kinase (ATP)
MSKVAPSSSAEGPEQITFAEDGSSKKRSGVRRPVFAELLSCEAEATPKPGRVHLLVNPFSGRKRGKKVGAAARKLLEAAGVEVELHPSERAGHLVELSKALELRPTDALAVVGGDGTLSEVITGRMRAGGDLPRVGVIPAGTGNAQATELGILNVEEAVRRIVAGRVIRIDLAEVDLRSGTAKRPGDALRWYSHNLVTWGLGVDSVVLAERMRWLGPARYDVGIVIKILANVRRRATLTVDGHAMEDDYTLFLIQNTQTGGAGLRLAPGASLDDGVMDLGILRRMTTSKLINAFGMLKQEGRHVFHPSVGSHRFKELAIDTPEPTAINIDGELAGVTPLKMRVLERVLPLFAA